jgi:galactofuranosylgalactofuranosylrhamnosyl-N-acetylglucosaminyl-diphospho-decaprenol beta-1,5/1,6-galactofuranosyltransferase
VLQKFLFPLPSKASELYFHVGQGNVTCYYDHLTAGAFADISFNRFFNSFYESYWVEYTPIQAIDIVLEGRGRLWCSVFRQNSKSEPSLIRRELLNLGNSAEIIRVDLAVPSSGEQGRLYIEIETANGPVTLDGISWRTTSEPSREISLGVAICTHNREALVAPTVKALLQSAADACIRRIVVVNQGTTASCSKLFDLQVMNAGVLRVIQQPNHGGSGGFTRGAMELLQSGACTHILFLDDDAELDPRHLATAVSFLRFAYSPLVLGGQMLDLLHPTSMFESGGRVENNRILANHRDVELAEPSSLAEFASVARSDFSGWWFAIFPAECFRTHGLPLPLFIHVDDVEYGVRLTESHVATVVLPGVGVWHQPFISKPPSWYSYYDVRNWAIFSSLYPARLNFESPRALIRKVLGMLIRYEYQQILCLELGLEDFLQGPEVMDTHPVETQARIRALLDVYAPQELSSPLERELGTARIPTGPNALRLRLAISVLRVLLGFPKENQAGPECIFRSDTPLDFVYLGRSYVLTGSGGYFLLLRYSRRRTWLLFLLALRTICRYAAGRRRAAAQWKNAYSSLKSHDSWWSRFQNFAHQGITDS